MDAISQPCMLILISIYVRKHNFVFPDATFVILDGCALRRRLLPMTLRFFLATTIRVLPLVLVRAIMPPRYKILFFKTSTHHFLS